MKRASKKFSRSTVIILAAIGSMSPLSLAQERTHVATSAQVTVQGCKDQIKSIFTEEGVPYEIESSVSSEAVSESPQAQARKLYPLYRRIKLEVSPGCSPILASHFKALNTVEKAREEIARAKQEYLEQRKKAQAHTLSITADGGLSEFEQEFAKVIADSVTDAFAEVFNNFIPASKSATLFVLTDAVPEAFELPLMTEDQFVAWIEKSMPKFASAFGARMKEILPQNYLDTGPDAGPDTGVDAGVVLPEQSESVR